MNRKIVNIFISVSIVYCMVFPGYSLSKESSQAGISTGKILFHKDYKEKSQIFVIDEEGKSKRLTDAGNNSEPRWSPEGTRIAFTSNRDGHLEVYIMNADGKKQQRVTHTTNGFSRFPRWSSDGMGVYFFSNIKGNLLESMVYLGTGEIRILNETGKVREIKVLPLEELKKKNNVELKKTAEEAEVATKELLNNVNRAFKIYPSPDGKHQLVYYRHPSRRLSIIDTKTKIQKELGVTGDDPAWSKDSKKIALFIEPIPSGTLAIYELDKGKYEKIEVSTDTNEECYNPSWSRDSKKIVYACGPVAGPGDSWLYILDLEAKKSEKLIQGSSPDWY